MAETAYTLNITVRNKIATTTDPATVVNGNNDYTVVFDFDSEWDSLSSKTAMFVYGREEQKYKTVTFTGNSCVMPALYNTGYVLIGVFAGDIKTTTAAYVKCIPCIRDNDSTPDTGSGGTIDTGTNDHSQLINRDIADQHPISAITGLEEALTPLVGTTQTITPSQVLAAIKAGRDIALQYTDSHYGSFVFSAFSAHDFGGVVASNLIIPQLDGLTGTLMGTVEDDQWFFNTTNTATKDDVGTAVNEALAQAKASGEFDGADGITPTIGDNGNWYLGDTDTGKPSRGDKGSDGKSAYQYAQDGGYTGTEAEFAAKLAQEKFASPNALTFTGAVTGSYDGSAALSVKIPEGGSGEAWELLYETTLTEDTATFSQEIPACSKVKIVIFPGSVVIGWKRIIINGTSYPTINSTMSAIQAYFVSIDTLLPPYITASIGIYTEPNVNGINGGYNYFSYAKIGDSITKIECGTAEMLVTGAIIKIWGVRK